MKKEEKQQLIASLEEAANSEVLNPNEMEVLEGGLLDKDCVHNHVAQCGCTTIQKNDSIGREAN